MMMYYRFSALTLFFLITLSCKDKKNADAQTNQNNKMNSSTEVDSLYLLAGTYTGEDGGEGIYLFKFDSETGNVDSLDVISVENPSYLTLSPDEQFVYSVSESGEESLANAFAFDKKNETLEFLNSEKTMGADPCYIETNGEGGRVFTANYSGGSITAFGVKDNGHLEPTDLVMEFEGSGPDTVRQEKAHLHSVRYSPDERYLFATDLGADKIYRFNTETEIGAQDSILAKDNMEVFSTPSEFGPRHFDFHPNGEYLYLLGELSGEIIGYDYNNGDLKEQQIITADSVGARGSADIHIAPDGKFLYASNRLKADGIAIFSINPDNGELTKVGYQDTGKHPRNFIITPNGKLLLVANLEDDNIQVFSINQETGLLSDTHKDIKISKPVCLKFAQL